MPVLSNIARRPSRIVSVGSLGIGGSEPIRLQSMLTADTNDIATVLQEIEELAMVNCELIRITIPNQKAIESLPLIRSGMQERGIALPIVADIHFNPQLAEKACEFVEKVRINPGNYADRKRFAVRTYSDAEYAEELQRIEERLQPLIRQLKRYQRALRVGTNHGSLSDRIVNRYGNSPVGMVESAMEFLRILQKYDFHKIIISMKSSNPLVMMQAYRRLVVQMEKEKMDYPLHLGVTEAGNQLDGRIKSAVGIGGLLIDGIGDTIRVSLTEPAPNEIPAATNILAGIAPAQRAAPTFVATALQLSYEKRKTETVTISHLSVGGETPFRFLAFAPSADVAIPQAFDGIVPLPEDQTESNVIHLFPTDFQSDTIRKRIEDWQGAEKPALILLHHENPLRPVRWLAKEMKQTALAFPIGVVLPILATEAKRLGICAEIGNLIAEGLIQALVCSDFSSNSQTFQTAQALLQATRVRLFKADFISCPSCGRTFFDLQKTTAAIKQKTAHLKGVKIGIMGCVVNGPGEMADADFGYVGTGFGKISLYKGQACVQRNLPETEAVEHLIALIKESGQWVEPE